MKSKTISFVTPCFNEELNVRDLFVAVKKVMNDLPYDYEHIFIDNASNDNTVKILKELAIESKNLRIIINTRNFGHVRSPFYGILQTSGDACILISADFQDPPEMIPQFIEKWEQGFNIVLAKKVLSEEHSLMFHLRNSYYVFLNKISEIPLTENCTGYGILDQKVVNILRQLDSPYPYLRGLLCEIGFPISLIPFNQPQRKKGKSKNNFYSLYDSAMSGIVNHSKLPLRIMAIGGFILSFLSLLVAILFIIAKLLFWNSFSFGIAPILIGIFFFGSLQAFFIGVVGEYIGSIYTQVRKLPLVTEAERINFD
jgi:glycosyltransferase involved in cell wall biosynthesis